ncbi:type II secretion system protein J [Chloroflexota bacterium]
MNISIMKRLIKSRLRLYGGQKGFSLLEVLAALGILGAIGASFTSALFAGLRATEITAEFATVDRLTRTQIEFIKNATYDETLPLEYPIIATPSDYYISLGIVKGVDTDGDGGTYQTITITISSSARALWTMDVLKVKGL